MESVSLSLGFVEELAGSINVPVDLLKTMLLMLSSLVLAPAFRVMKDPVARQLYSLLLGLGYVFYLQK